MKCLAKLNADDVVCDMCGSRKLALGALESLNDDGSLRWRLCAECAADTGIGMKAIEQGASAARP